MIARYAGFIPGAFPIEAYGAGGFRFAGMSHRGSILALPSGIFAWKADAPSDIDAASLQPLFDAEPGSVEWVIIGSGTNLAPPSAALRDRLREAGMGVEAMGTGAAVRTYNILLGERRPVAAALLAVE